MCIILPVLYKYLYSTQIICEIIISVIINANNKNNKIIIIP